MFFFKYQSQSGQVLLLIVLFITSLLTVVMAISFRAARDTQLTLAQTEVTDLRFIAETAAEQMIALRSENPDTYGPGSYSSYQELFTQVGISGDEFPTISLDASSIRVEAEWISDSFETPSLEKDQQYMLYLSAYRPLADGRVHFEQAYDDDLEMVIRTVDDNDTKKCTEVAVELTVVHGVADDYQVARFVMDAPEIISASGDTRNFTPTRVPGTSGSGFECVAPLINPPNTAEFKDIPNKRLLIARVMYEDAGIEQVFLEFRPLDNALPPQGISFISQAVSVAGLRQTVTVFQSYPQIPADMFVTQF